MKTTETKIIDTADQMKLLVDWLLVRHGPPAEASISSTMYIDLEGINLCRKGTISILTLLVEPDTSTKRVYLIDVHTLGAQAFNTAGDQGKTLQDVLQNGDIPKGFFDVRNDSDALFSLFGVKLQGVEDVQLMESATRKTTASRKYLSGLTKCVENHITDVLTFVGPGGLASWKLAKEKGERLYRAEHGGSYEVFNQRPIPEDIVAYCVGDVQYLPKLWKQFWKHQTYQWQDLVAVESRKRVEMSQKEDYEPHGSGRALAPWTEAQNVLLNEWNYVPPSYNDGWDDGCGSMSCRDIIPSWQHDDYYSD